MERLDLAYGHRHAATTTALFLLLEQGEIGLVEADNSIWMRNYEDVYFQIGFSMSVGSTGLNGTLTANRIPYASGTHTLANTSLVYDPATGNLATPAVLNVGSYITLDGPGQQITTNFLECLCSAVIHGLLNLGAPGLNVNSGKFTVDGSDGNTFIGGELAVAQQAVFGKSTAVAEAAPISISTSGVLTVAIDAYIADIFEISPYGAGSTKILNPSNPSAGRRIMFRIIPLGSGASIMVFDTAYHFSGNVAPAIDWTASGCFYIGFSYNARSSRWDCVGSVIGPFT